MNTRYMWKYVTIQGVFATPLFNIDGLKVGGLDTFDDWKAALDPLVVLAAHELFNKGEPWLQRRS
jgi:hypothetical protein